MSSAKIFDVSEYSNFMPVDVFDGRTVNPGSASGIAVARR
jgi:hypothetical protein